MYGLLMRPLVIGLLVGALLGTTVVLVGWHLWVDHRFVDAIRAAQQAQIAQQAQQIQLFQKQQLGK